MCLGLLSAALIDGLLQVDPIRRLTCAQIQQQPWFTSGNDPEESDVPPAMYASCQIFHSWCSVGGIIYNFVCFWFAGRQSLRFHRQTPYVKWSFILLSILPIYVIIPIYYFTFQDALSTAQKPQTRQTRPSFSTRPLSAQVMQHAPQSYAYVSQLRSV